MWLCWIIVHVGCLGHVGVSLFQIFIVLFYFCVNVLIPPWCSIAYVITSRNDLILPPSWLPLSLDPRTSFMSPTIPPGSRIQLNYGCICRMPLGTSVTENSNADSPWQRLWNDTCTDNLRPWRCFESAHHVEVWGLISWQSLFSWHSLRCNSNSQIFPVWKSIFIPLIELGTISVTQNVVILYQGLHISTNNTHNNNNNDNPYFYVLT